jgi:hypothetical protein
MAASDDRDEVALSSSELDDVLSSAGLSEGDPLALDDDLDQYGVWVKVKPEAVSSRTASALPPVAESVEPESVDTADLTDDEQNLLAELETGEPEAPPDLGDLDLELEPPAEETPSPPLTGETDLSIDEDLGTGEEIGLGEPGAPTLDEEIASLDEQLGSLGAEESFGGPSEEIALPEVGLSEEQVPALDLDDDLVLEEPMGASADDDIELEIAGAPETAQPVDETGMPLLDDDIILEESPLESVEDDFTFGEPERRTPAGVAELEAAGALEPETPMGLGDSSGIDLENEVDRAARRELSRPSEERPDTAALVLEKIERELSAIRREISDLKEELTVLRKERDDITAPPKADDEDAVAGFFGAEEDETIALTGDELDNILNTADVTEATLEAGPETDGEPGPFEGVDLVSADILDEDILERAEAVPRVTEADMPALGAEGTFEAEVSEGMEDESSLLPSEDLGTLDFSEDDGGGEGAIVETDEPEAEEGMPIDLAADLAAEAEAAVAESGEPEAMEIDLEAEMGPAPAVGPTAGMDLDNAMEDLLPSGTGIELDTPIDESQEAPMAASEAKPPEAPPIPDDLRDEIKSVLAYLDQLLEALPDEKIEEFAKSEYFGVYKKLFVELGLED